jgi:hypothetical protein
MLLTITSIELKSPLKFFALSYNAMKILPQLKQENCKAFKKQGKWTTHYTMTLWQNADDMTTFARSGAHLEAMKKSAALAKEIRTLTIEADQLIDWKTAKKLLLDEGKLLTF